MESIFIRADGGKKIGFGHIMRMSVLAKELQKKYNVIFVCKNEENYATGIEKLKEMGFLVEVIYEEKIYQELKRLCNKYNSILLITDSYDVDDVYFDKVKSIFRYTGYIDDVNKCKMNVDFVINQNLNAKNFDYKTESNTKLLLGPQYCMLRDEFRSNNYKFIKNKVENVLITVGGMDNDYNTLKIIKILEEYNFDLHVVIGGAFDRGLIEELKYISKKNSKIKIYFNAVMSEIMKICDMAISASGSTMYELAAMQLPTVGIVIADNQKLICKSLGEKGVIVGTGDLIYKDKMLFCKMIDELIESSELRMKLSKNQKKLVNINGVENIVEQILKIINNT